MESTRLLMRCVRAQHVAVRQEGDWVVLDPSAFGGADVALQIATTEELARKGGFALASATLVTSLPDGHRIVDVCADLGEGAGDDAFEAAVSSALHKHVSAIVPALRASLGQKDSPAPHHGEAPESLDDAWRLDAGAAVVQRFGNGARGEEPDDDIESRLRATVPAIRRAVDEVGARHPDLDARDLHAVRVFVQLTPTASGRGAPDQVEALWGDPLSEADPASFAELEAALERIGWPAVTRPTSLRVHLVLRRRDVSFEPADRTSHRFVRTAVEIAAVAAAGTPDMSDEELEDLLVDRGFGIDLAARAVAFVPMAFAVHALHDRGLTVPTEYGVRLPNGRARLAPMRSEPVFVAAWQLAERLAAEGRYGTSDAVARRSPLTVAADRVDQSGRSGLVTLPPPIVWSGHTDRVNRFATRELPAGKLGDAGSPDNARVSGGEAPGWLQKIWSGLKPRPRTDFG